MKRFVKAVRNAAAFVVTVVVGIVVGTALFTVETYDDLETDSKRRTEHRRPLGRP